MVQVGTKESKNINDHNDSGQQIAIPYRRKIIPYDDVNILQRKSTNKN